MVTSGMFIRAQIGGRWESEDIVNVPKDGIRKWATDQRIESLARTSLFLITLMRETIERQPPKTAVNISNDMIRGWATATGRDALIQAIVDMAIILKDL